MSSKSIYAHSSVMPLRFHYADTDMGGVIHHANYLRVMERAYDAWYEILGFDRFAWHAKQLYLVVRRTQLNYHHSVTVWKQFEIVTRPIALTRLSVTLYQQIRLVDEPETLYFDGEIVMVAVGANGRPCRLPQELTEKLERKS